MQVVLKAQKFSDYLGDEALESDRVSVTFEVSQRNPTVVKFTLTDGDPTYVVDTTELFLLLDMIKHASADRR